ncbi:adenylate kinase [Nevskia soli]|uniref:adenylate kinase n=1 Tax=Nevskia soli TaxID=418856 RepID=UPI0004A734E8|nr:adenylate kinase [Nevskia soli]
MRMILLGAPGSGKGTQGEKLAHEFGVPRLSTGDALRAAVSDGTELGRKAKSVMDAGGLVADDIVVQIVESRLAQPDTAGGFILDGFPRNTAQARTLDALLRGHGTPLDLALHLEVDDEELVQRLLLRAQQQDRADDREEVIRCRIRVYGEETRPLLDYYGAQGKLVVVPGTGAVEDIFQRIVVRLAEAAGKSAFGGRRVAHA